MPEEIQNGGSPAGAADTGSAAGAQGGGQEGSQGSQGGQSGQGGQASSGEQNGSQQPSFAVPDAYKEKSWAGKVKSQDDVYKLIDNLDQLVGKKVLTEIDYSKATQEEIDAHFAKLAPKDKSEYKLNAAAADPAVADAIAEAFMKAGVNPHQSNKILGVLAPVIQKIQTDQKTNATSEEGYMKLSKEAFGEDFQKTIGRVEAVLKQHAPDDASKKVLDDMPNDHRIAVDKTVNKIIEGYEARIAKIMKDHGIKETGAQADGGQGAPTSNVDTQRKELRAQIRQIYSRPHTAAEKQALIDKLNATYKQQ